MYTPKAYGSRSLLWFISGIGWTGNRSPFECQRRGMVCEMLPWKAAANARVRGTKPQVAGYKRRDANNRVVYLN